MRIVDVSAFYTPLGGGVRTYVNRKMATLPAMGHEIVVVVPGRHNSVVERQPGAVMVTIASPALPIDRRYHYFADRAALHDVLDTWRPDFVEASSPWSSATKVGEWQGAAPRSLFMHADPMSSYAYRWLGGLTSHANIDRVCQPFWNHLRELDAMFDVVVSPGASFSRRLAAGGMTKVRTVALGVEPGAFGPRFARPQLRAELLARLGLPDDGLILVGIGRFAPEKRWPMVVEAAIAAARNRPIGMLLIGSGKKARILRAANGAANIEIAPAIADRHELASLLASSCALVHGCESETFCLVASEARASGLPIIVPDRGGAYDQLGAGAGLAYRAGDGDALRNAIERLYDAPDAFSALSQALRVRTMNQHFHDLVARYEAIVQPTNVRVPTVAPVDLPAALIRIARIEAGQRRIAALAD